MTYARKSINVEAWQYKGEYSAAFPSWLSHLVLAGCLCFREKPAELCHPGLPHRNIAYGDWVLCGQLGDISVVSDDEFRANYELMPEAAP